MAGGNRAPVGASQVNAFPLFACSSNLPARGSAAARCLSLVCALTLALAQALGAGDEHVRRTVEPLFFFVGLQGPGAADIARSIGLNALAYRLPEDAPARIGEIRAELLEAHRAGLKIILQLPTNLSYQQQLTHSFTPYWRGLEAYIAAVVPALKDLPGLVAWQTDDYLESAIKYDDGEFRQFLAERYDSLVALNRAWGASFRRWSEVTSAAALTVDEKQPFGVGRSSVDVADWQLETTRRMMQRWAGLIRGHDPDHLLMTGRISLYRTLACIPPVYDIVVPAIRPDVLEDDPLTCNVHAIDMARRGGRFGVIPAIHMPLPPSRLFHEGALRVWVAEAAAHGARGVALQDWTRFTTFQRTGETKPRPLSSERIMRRAALVHDMIASLLNDATFSVEPRPSYAFLWTPYAGGLQALNVPAYGFLPSWSPTEPSVLFFVFRRGCAWGNADFLTPDDVPVADLDRYGVIFAPHALSVADPAQQALEDWVLGGGVLVADVGLGMYQSGGWQGIPSPLSTVMGIGRLHLGRMVVGTWQVTRPHPLLPGLRPGARAVGVSDRPPRITVTPSVSVSAGPRGAPGQDAGTGNKSTSPEPSAEPYRPPPLPATAFRPTAIKSWATYARQPADVTAVAIADTQPVPGAKARVVAGIFAHSYGEGGGVFASFRLWGRWLPDDPLFAVFHDTLCRRNASYGLVGKFWPDQFEIVPERNGVAIVARAAGVVEVSALRAEDAVYAGAYCLASAEYRLPDGRRSGDVSLLVEVPAAGLVRVRKLPVHVRPYERSCLSRMELYGPRAVELVLYGDGALMRGGAGQTVKVLRAKPVPVRVVVSDGVYKVKPGSRHVITIASADSPPNQVAVTAGPGGQLSFDAVANMTKVSVQPGGGG